MPEPPAISTVSDDSFDSFENSENNRDFDEEKRVKLREVELKAIQYQDELESGQRSLKSGWSMQQQVEHYRRKLMKKTYKEMQDSPILSAGRDSRSQTSLKRSPSPLDISKRAKKSKRSPSPTYARSVRRKSVSPPRSARSSKRDRVRSRSRSRSRSYSASPKRYRWIPHILTFRTRNLTKLYVSDRSPSPPSRSSSQRSSGEASRSVRSTRELSPATARYSTSTISTSSSSASLRHRNEKHRHKHKY